MNCPIQSKECQKAECALWRHDRCGVMDAILTLDNIAEHLEAISGALEDIRDRGFPTPTPSSWEQHVRNQVSRQASELPASHLSSLCKPSRGVNEA